MPIEKEAVCGNFLASDICLMHQDIRCPAYILKDKLANANLKDEYRLL